LGIGLYVTISTEVVSVPLDSNSIFPGADCVRILLYQLLSLFGDTVMNTGVMYEGKSISKLQMDIELKQIRVLIEKCFYFST
jgi:hypothetical protein